MRWILALAACGCRGLLGIEQPIDAAIDTPIPIDEPGACAFWHPQGFDPCALGAALPALQLDPGDYLYDTTSAGGKLSEIRLDNTMRSVLSSVLTVMQSDGSEVAVLSVEALAIKPGASLRVTGVKPLLVVAWSTIHVQGAIDASSHIGSTPLGAGANQACPDPTTLRGGDAPNSGGSGGGGGGGHQGAGGAGGASDVTRGGPGGTGLSATVIRGGCSGGDSGAAGQIAQDPATSSSHAAGGGGGGAIRLVAHDAIDITGSVSANGAGGAGALQNSVCGGGGGGAGGYIGLEAPAVTISGAIAANGGGGGGGGGRGDQGFPGSDGRLDLQPASGGTGSTGGCGRPGGEGAAQTSLDGEPGVPFVLAPPCTVNLVAGGGGGGGASGFVLVASPAYQPGANAKISPPVLMQ